MPFRLWRAALLDPATPAPQVAAKARRPLGSAASAVPSRQHNHDRGKRDRRSGDGGEATDWGASAWGGRTEL